MTGPSPTPGPDEEPGLWSGTADVVDVARVVGSVAWRSFVSLAKGSVDAVQDVVSDVRAGQPITRIVDHQLAQAQSAVLETLGLQETRPVAPGRSTWRVVAEPDLREVGDAILKGSWQPDGEARGAPAFASMLRSLTGDEARILRFLAVAGPQPAVDVRTRTPFGIGSERLAAGSA